MKSIKGIAISPSAPATKDLFEKQEERQGVVQHGESGVKGAKGTNLWTGTKKKLADRGNDRRDTQKRS